MKEYIFLYKFNENKYFPIDEKIKNNLIKLNYFLLTDFRPWDNDFLHKKINLYNANFIYHNFKTNMLSIGFADWLINEDIDGPAYKDFAVYVQKVPTCSMLVENFIEFKAHWINLKKELPAFAIIYRDDKDWINCKGFNTQEEISAFCIS